MPRIDKHRVAELVDRLEKLREDWAAIRPPVEFVTEGSCGTTMSDPASYFRRMVAADAKGMFRPSGSISKWAFDVVDAFGIERFPTYCTAPPTDVEISAATESERALPEILTGVADEEAAGLRIILWAALNADEKLLDVPRHLPRISWKKMDDWTEWLVVEGRDVFTVETEPIQWIKKAFGRLVQNFEQPQTPPESPNHGNYSAKSSRPRGNKSGVVEKKSFTQGELNTAIEQYKINKASSYDQLCENVRKGKKGAIKAARKMFGRNAVAKELGVKAPAMVSKSPVWQKIAVDLDLPRKANQGASRTRVGAEIGFEEAAQEAGDLTEKQVINNETQRLLRANLSAEHAEATIEKLQRGKMTDEQAREMLTELKRQ